MTFDVLNHHNEDHDGVDSDCDNGAEENGEVAFRFDVDHGEGRRRNAARD